MKTRAFYNLYPIFTHCIALSSFLEFKIFCYNLPSFKYLLKKNLINFNFKINLI